MAVDDGRIAAVDGELAAALGRTPDDLVGRAVGDVLADLAAEVRRARDAEDELRRSERRLAEAQQLARLGSWEWDIPGNRVLWSDELFRIYGLEPQSLEPSYEAFLGYVHPDDRDDVDARNRKAFADHQPFEDVKRVVRADGQVILMRTQGEVVEAPDGSPLRMIGVCEDVTAERRAAEAESRLAAVVRSSTDAILTVDEAGAVRTWNPGAEAMLGRSAAEVVGLPLASAIAGPQPHADAGRVADVLAGRPSEPWESSWTRGDGETVDVSVACSPMGDPTGQGRLVAVIARDISDRKRIEAQLEHLADHDGLTGLANRRAFDRELVAATATCARHRQTAAVLVVDLDDFKAVNDWLGHHAGDELLRGVASALGRRVRAEDVLARLGGDEFGVLLRGAGPVEAEAVARDLLSTVRGHTMILGGQRICVTASVGLALVGPGADQPEDVLAAADRALYEAKEAGRDRHALGTTLTARDEVPLRWEHRIRRALAEDRFELHCQPILDLRRDVVDRYELLLRLRETDGTLTPPGAFLGVAERLGLMREVDRWVVGQAIALAAAHPRLLFEVNLSARSMDDPDLLPFVEHELRRTGAAPSSLVFEITETATIASMDDARRFALALRRLGCELAIDDFGAGFGSFAYLKQLPAGYLKIDGDFVRTPRTATDERIIASIVSLAAGQQQRTIAEFVGDEATVARLRELGVDFAQGFHVGRPFPVAELEEGDASTRAAG